MRGLVRSSEPRLQQYHNYSEPWKRQSFATFLTFATFLNHLSANKLALDPLAGVGAHDVIQGR
jgi:hypothetical protein